MVKKRILKTVECLRFPHGYAYVVSECESCGYFAGMDDEYVKCTLDSKEKSKGDQILEGDVDGVE